MALRQSLVDIQRGRADGPVRLGAQVILRLARHFKAGAARTIASTILLGRFGDRHDERVLLCGRLFEVGQLGVEQASLEEVLGRAARRAASSSRVPRRSMSLTSAWPARRQSR